MTSAEAALQDRPAHAADAPSQGGAPPDLLLHLAAPQQGELAAAIERAQHAAELLGGGLRVAIAFATPDGRLAPGEASSADSAASWLSVHAYQSEAQPFLLPSVHTAADYTAALTAARSGGAKVCVMLGPDPDGISAQGIAALAAPALNGSADLVLPLYELGPFEGLVNTAILYPLTRSLFGGRLRYPLGFDLAMSRPMQERLLAVCSRTQSPAETPAWPGSEAIIAGLAAAQAAVGPRRFSQVEGADLASILTAIVGSLFAEIESKAPQWQRARRVAQPSGSESPPAGLARPPLQLAAAEAALDAPESASMIETFRLGASNLNEVWGLALPPNTLLAVRKLARVPDADFRMDDALWARIVYDFALAYRLRAVSRSHLLGAFVPLYLGWVASHVMTLANADLGNASGAAPAVGGAAPSGAPIPRDAVDARVESLAQAFEADKSYLLARWRWPDRFNP